MEVQENPVMQLLSIQLAAAVLLWRRRKKQRCGTRQWWVRPLFQCRQQYGEFHHLVNDMRLLKDHETFYAYFRMSPARFDQLLAMVGPVITKQNTSFRESTGPKERLALTIRYLAHGDSQRMLSMSYRIGRSTVSGIISETCASLWQVLYPKYVNVPNVDGWRKIAEDFYHMWNFPNCLGAIDGKHVLIQAPANSGSQYYNYKHAFSIVLLAVCDANYCFTLVDIGDYGKHSDGGIFRNSSFGKAILEKTFPLPHDTPLPGTNMVMPHVFVGDSAFPLHQNIMRPYPGLHLPMKKATFNYRLSRARRVVENAFGILASKWRIYRKPICACEKNLDLIVKATVSMHNFLRTTDLQQKNRTFEYCPVGYVDYEDSAGNIHPGQWHEHVSQKDSLQDPGMLGSNRYSQSHSLIRDMFAEYFSSNAGEVPWQQRIVNRGTVNMD